MSGMSPRAVTWGNAVGSPLTAERRRAGMIGYASYDHGVAAILGHLEVPSRGRDGHVPRPIGAHPTGRRRLGATWAGGVCLKRFNRATCLKRFNGMARAG